MIIEEINKTTLRNQQEKVSKKILTLRGKFQVLRKEKDM